MWRVFIIIVVVGYALFRIGNGVTGHLERQADRKGKGGVGWFSTVAGMPRDGFAEVRILMAGGGKEIEIVTVIEQPGENFCEPTHFERNLKQFCRQGMQCSVKKASCSADVEPRFRKMLDQQPASVHYAHVAQVRSSGKPRQGILLAWGLTEQQSKLLCEMAYDMVGPNEEVTCI